MASKSDILKRIRASKKGESTWQDKNRLKTWKDAGQGSILQKEGYNRAVRNMQKAAQQGRAFNEVDTQIFSAYVKETPEQLLSKSKTFMNLATWLPVGGLAAKGVQLGAKALGKLAAPKVVKKAAAPKVKPPSRLKKIRAAALETKVIGKGRRTPLAYVTPKGKPGAGRRHGLKPRDIKTARNIRTAAPAAVPIVLGGGLAALELLGKKAKPQAAMPESGARAGENAVAEKKRRATAAATKKKRLAEERRHASEFVGTGPRGAVDPKHILQDKPPKSKQEYDFFKGGKQEITLPKFLGGGKMTVDSSDAAFDYMDDPELNLKRGGRLKKKTKPRKRAALRGHRAELRGG